MGPKGRDGDGNGGTRTRPLEVEGGERRWGTLS